VINKVVLGWVSLQALRFSPSAFISGPYFLLTRLVKMSPFLES